MDVHIVIVGYCRPPTLGIDAIEVIRSTIPNEPVLRVQMATGMRFNWNDRPPSDMYGNEQAPLFVQTNVCCEVTLQDRGPSGVNILRIGHHQLAYCRPVFLCSSATAIHPAVIFHRLPRRYHPPYPEIIMDFCPPCMALDMCHAAAMVPEECHAVVLVLQSQGALCFFETTCRDDGPDGLVFRSMRLWPVVNQQGGKHVMPLASFDIEVLPPIPDTNLDVHFVVLRMVCLLPVRYMAVPINFVVNQQRGRHVMPLTGFDVEVIPDPDINFDIHG